MKTNPLKWIAYIAFYLLFVLVRILFQISEEGLLTVLHQTTVVSAVYLVFGVVFLLLGKSQLLLLAGPILAAGLIAEKLFVGNQTIVLFLFVYLFLLAQTGFLKEDRKGGADGLILMAWMLFLLVVPVYLLIQMYQAQKLGAISADYASIVNLKVNWPYYRYFLLLLAAFGFVMLRRPAAKGAKAGKEKANRISTELLTRQKEAYFLALLSIVETAVFVSLRGDFYLTVPVFDLWTLSLILLTVKGDLLANTAVQQVKQSAEKFLRKGPAAPTKNT